MELVLDAVLDALVDSAKMLPLLFVIYILIEVVEMKCGNKLGRYMAKAGAAGPLIGAAAGIIPQCGISVIGSALYTQRLITIGTLLAVFIATSDEAIPVILSQPEHASVLIPILVGKFLIAMVLGYLIDLVLRKRNAQVLSHIDDYAEGRDHEGHDHSHVLEEKGCCGHTPAAAEADGAHAHSCGDSLTRRLLLHPLVHTLKVFVFIFVVSLVLSLLFAFVGEERIGQALGSLTFLQPLICALVGLIPNCAASVAIAECYLSGIITFGACMAGLCSSAGLGLLVLLKECRKGEAWAIVAGLFVLALAIGYAFQLAGFAPAL